MRKLKISRTDFERAFEPSSYETTTYLDTETGAVIFVEDCVVNQLEDLLADEDGEDIEGSCLKLLFRGQAHFGASRMCCTTIPKLRRTGSDSAMSAKNDA